MEDKQELEALTGALAALIRRQQRLGRFVLPGRLPEKIAMPPTRPPALVRRGPEVFEDPLEDIRTRGLAGPIGLRRVRALLGDCRRCPLSGQRTHLVFGAGDPEAGVMFVGEGPGAEEDRQGEPFVGAAGQLLTRMLAAMGLRREEVYITNVVKCRPPGNRDPEPAEIAACLPFLKAQIEAIRPRILVTLGRVAAQALLGRPGASLGALRGRFHRLGDILVLATYHPAFLLRRPEYKRGAWEDLKRVMAEMDRLGLPRDRSKR